MNPQRHAQIKELFLAAVKLDEAAAAAFLDEACADDQDLRREVESLLAHHRDTTIFAKSPEEARTGKLLRPTQNIQKETLTQSPSGAAVPLAQDRFAPGHVIAGRYRILALLGRGGMGEVYRADDMTLNQPVALKFLSLARADDAVWLSRFREEVRLARKVTHPCVNRVYDLGEADGETFISMEYVDGENMASLLRQIGRLPAHKAIEVARQLCAGLGAAHDRGVIHRDLKPANIMIDGRGQVHITDFGIASLAAEEGKKTPLAGTPEFMAPELFAGQEPSISSDLYSLGAVLYEMATGEKPFGQAPPNQRESDLPPVSPSVFSPDIDPGFERMILQCLKQDPKLRPESAYEVAAGLPGGDPLAAAVAAGDTPSPGMVAAAGGFAAMQTRTAVVCLAVALIGLFAVVMLADSTFFLPQAGLTKPPAVLADKAEDVIDELGHEALPGGRVRGFTIDREYLKYQLAHDDRHSRWEGLPTARPPAVAFWYRQGDSRLVPPSPLGEPTQTSGLTPVPPMNTVRLDGAGRLLRFNAFLTPSRSDRDSSEVVASDNTFLPPALSDRDSAEITASETDRLDMQLTADDFWAASEIDWSIPFRQAGLKLEDFHSIEPVRDPPMYADQVKAWLGICPENPQILLRIEAAALDGRVVHFDIVHPWQRGDRPSFPKTLLSPTCSRTFAVRFLVYATVLLAAIVMAWHNSRLGRGDREGATRLALFVLVLSMADWIVGERHVGVFAEEAAACLLWAARSTFAAAVAWTYYMALEPYVRRFWPQSIITWTRLLRGQCRDPLVGRSILFGCLFGITLVLIRQIDAGIPSWLGFAPPVPILPGVTYDLGELLGLRYKLGTVLSLQLASISLGMVMLMLLLLLRVGLRSPWLAAAAFCLLLAVLFSVISAGDVFLPWGTNTILAACMVFVLTRIGLLALITGLFVRSLIIANPVTSNLEAWYAPASEFTVILVVALLIYGFHTAMAGRLKLGYWLPDGGVSYKTSER